MTRQEAIGKLDNFIKQKRWVVGNSLLIATELVDAGYILPISSPDLLLGEGEQNKIMDGEAGYSTRSVNNLLNAQLTRDLNNPVLVAQAIKNNPEWGWVKLDENQELIKPDYHRPYPMHIDWNDGQQALFDSGFRRVILKEEGRK